MTLTPFELATANALIFSENLVQSSMLFLAAEPGPTPEDKARGERFLETALPSLRRVGRCSQFYVTHAKMSEVPKFFLHGFCCWICLLAIPQLYY